VLSGNVSSEVSIQVLVGKEAGCIYKISKPVTTIGRDAGNDIVLSDPSISREQARLIYNGTQWSIEKIRDYNKITINGRAVQQAKLQENDIIGLGFADTQLLFLASGGAPNGSFPAYTPKTHKITSGSLPSSIIPWIEVSTNISSDKQKYELTQSVLTIGRDPSNDICIDVPIVSTFHAQFVRENDSYVLVHPHPLARQQKTLNGLLYQGRHIRGDEVFRSEPLKRGDILRIGDAGSTVVTLAYNDGTGAPQEALPEIHPIQLSVPVITIGRHPDNIVVLDHLQVSAHHARLEQVQTGRYRIVDLSSTNHVYVNGQRVANQILQPRDEIRIGPFRLTYTGTALTQHDESNCVRIDALNLIKIINGKILLNAISLAIPPRKFIALVGGSGTGKSTLMDALNGLRPAHDGKVFYNGQNYYEALASFSTQLGYVPQKDIVHEDITVEHALFYAAKMRLPEDFIKNQIERRITEVLDDVGMKHKRELMVSQLSGGQKKRVSIALELLAKPSIFFLDEPTSGLDPGLDYKMMFLLRKLADKGHTIVLVTHATNNINFCDYVCFLAQGGRLAYFGPPDEAKKYFQKADFAHIYNELEPSEDKPAAPEDAESRFRASDEYKKYVEEPLAYGTAMRTQVLQQPTQAKPRKRGNPWKQFVLLSMRYLELLKNDTVNRWILLLQAPVIGSVLLLFILFGIGTVGGSGGFDPNNIVQCPVGSQVLLNGQPDTVPREKATSTDCRRVETFLSSDPTGKAYVGSRSTPDALQDFILPGPGEAPKILLIMAFAAVMFGCINGAREIVKELPIYIRERTVNLGIVPYIFSKIVVLGVLCLFQSLVIVLLVNLVDPFQKSVFLAPFLEVYITMALTSLAGLMLGLTVSALVSNTDRATSVIPVILIPQVIFSGALFPLTNGFMQFLGFFFPIRWAMAALGSTVGLHSDKLGGDALFGSNYSYHGLIYSTYSKGDAVVHLLFIWLALVIMSVLLGLATGYFLKKKDARV